MALRASEARSRVLAEMVEQSTDAIFTRDLEGRITYWNAGAERLYGYTAQGSDRSALAVDAHELAQRRRTPGR